MPNKKKIYLITILICVAFLAVLVLALTLPNAMKKSDAKKTLKSTEHATEMVLIDPLFGEGDLLGNRGKSAALSETELAQLKAQLAAVASGGLRYNGKSAVFGGGSDLRLQMVIDGQTVLLFLCENEFYLLSGDLSTRFSAKDANAYATLYQNARAILAAAQ